MSLSRAILGNTAIQVTGKVVGAILGILTVAVATRHLGLAAFGEFTTITTYLQFFGILVDFGLTLTMIRLISAPDADERRVASNIFTLRLVSAIAFYGAAVALVWLLPYPHTTRVGVCITSLSFLGITLSQTLVGVFQKKLAVSRAAIAEVVGRTVLFVGVIAAAKLGGGLYAIVSMLVAGNAIQFALNWHFVNRLLPISFAWDFAYWRFIVAESWPVGISIIFNLVYLKGDVLIMSLMRPLTDVGLYGAAYKVLDVVTIVPTAFMGIVMPVLTTAWLAQDCETYKRRLGRAYDLMTILAIPLALGTIPVATDLIVLVAGEEFRAAGPILAVLMGAGAMVFWSALFGHTVVAIGRQRQIIWAYAVNAALSVGLYLYLIPRFGPLGAAWTTLFSEALIAVLTAVAIMRDTAFRPSLVITLKSLVAGGAMCVLLYAMPMVPVLLRILLGAVAYFALLFALRAIRPNDIKSIVGART